MPRRFFPDFVAFFSHPYWGSGQFVAKIAVATATFIWGALIVINPSLFTPVEFPVYTSMVAYMPADHWSWGAIGIGGSALVRLFLKQSSVRYNGTLGSFAMMLFWGYLAVQLWMLPYPMRPGQAAAVFVIGALSIYAFLATPRSLYDHPG